MPNKNWPRPCDSKQSRLSLPLVSMSNKKSLSQNQKKAIWNHIMAKNCQRLKKAMGNPKMRKNLQRRTPQILKVAGKMILAIWQDEFGSGGQSI
jgi:hypothetical protein